MNPPSKVAVLMGGIGSERQVSLLSGANIVRALGGAGFEVAAVDITPDDLSILDDKSIEVFFLALHGEFGEDGRLQHILEEQGLIYTGSDACASRLAFDKAASKAAFRAAGINVAEDILITTERDLLSLPGQLTKFGAKFVVKPIREGSSVGVSIVQGPDNACSAARQCWHDHGDCMVEAFVQGRELTVGILDGKPLPIIEIKSRTAFYDYEAKYVDDATQYLFDTVASAKTVKRLQETAAKCFEVLGCRHMGRVDMILTDEDVDYVLEINTLPGFTSHSLLPMAAARAGLGPEALCGLIVRSAWRDAGSPFAEGAA